MLKVKLGSLKTESGNVKAESCSVKVESYSIKAAPDSLTVGQFSRIAASCSATKNLRRGVFHYPDAKSSSGQVPICDENYHLLKQTFNTDDLSPGTGYRSKK